MSRVRITVIKKAFFEDLVKAYLTDGLEAGDCPIFSLGDSFTVDKSCEMPAGFCTFAWQDIFYMVHSLLGGATYTPWWNRNGMQVACCTDGTRPVSFLIERIED